MQEKVEIKLTKEQQLLMNIAFAKNVEDRNKAVEVYESYKAQQD